MPQIKGVLDKALELNQISRQEWESVIEYATLAGEAVRDGENHHLFRLVALLEGGVVMVEGVPHVEVLRRLAVFA